MRKKLSEGGFAFLPNTPGATGISQVTVTDTIDVVGNLAVGFGDQYGNQFTIYMPPSQWRLVCDILIASHPHIRWNVSSIV